MRYAIKEKKHMENLGGRRLPASGRALPWEDGIIGKFQVQLKITKKDFYELRLNDVRKLVKHSIIAGQEPLFVVFFEKYGVYAIVYPLEPCADPPQKSKRILPLRETDEVVMCGAKWKVEIVPKSKAKEFISKLGGKEKHMR